MKNVFLISMILIAAAPGSAYIPVLLHNPEFGPFSYAYAAGHGQQVGNTAQIGGHALLWEGTAASATILTPTGYSRSAVYGVHGGKQVGAANPIGGLGHAIMWSGSANDFINLHPLSGFRESYAVGIGGNQQVGGGTDPTGEANFALLWRGTPESAVNLHPGGSYALSEALATDGFQQVGGAQIGPNARALLWHGTAESVIDLTPPGAKSATVGGVAKGQQVGNAQFGDRIAGALWHGTAESFVDMTPPGHAFSYLTGTNGEKQCGNAMGAAVWSGTPESWVSLHALLPPEWGAITSWANGIDEVGNVVGWFRGPQGSRAVMWVVPEPSTVAALAAGTGLLALRRRKAARLRR